MSKDPQIDFSNAKQDRSKKTLDDLLQAAYAIVEAADPAEFTSRTLANKAGYSLGTLSRRLSSVQDVFFWAIQKGREIKINEVAKEMIEFDSQSTIRDFIEHFIGRSFTNINTVTPKVMRFYDDRYTKKYGLTTNYFDYIDLMVEPYLETCRRNQTDTFRILSKEEARLAFRAILMISERIFAQHDPIAGTAEHRRILVDLATRMLAK